MLNNFINDKKEEADMDIHKYMTAKMQEVAGTKTEVNVPLDTDNSED